MNTAAGDTKRILVVEDEPDVRLGLRTLFEAEGMQVAEAEDGLKGLDLASSERPDLIVLDLMIPVVDGFEVCRQLRARGSVTPILILTARATEVDKVLGLELGADDYVTKPFAVRELLARVKALLRRSRIRPDTPARIQIGSTRIDLERQRAHREDGEVAELYHYELEILRLLLERRGEVVSRREILDAVWGENAFPTTRTVDYHVCNLRKKIEPDPAKPAFLLTAHGVGYRLTK